MAFVEGTGGAINSGLANKKPAQTNKPSGSSGGGTSYNPYADYMAQMNAIYAQQKAAAEEAERRKREAAQQAYDRNMAALNAAYNNQLTTLKGNYDSTLAQLQGNYDQGAAGVNRNADSAQQQAYINYMMGKRDLPQQMAAQGLSGGAAESTLAGMYNSYGNSRNAIDTDRNQSLAELLHNLNNSKESALQAYNGQVSDAEAARLAYQMQLEQNLANAIADAASVNYDQQFQISSDYLAQMGDLQSKMASAAQKAATNKYSANNSNASVNTSQGGGVDTKNLNAAAKKAKELYAAGYTDDDVMYYLGSQNIDTPSIMWIMKSMGL